MKHLIGLLFLLTALNLNAQNSLSIQNTAPSLPGSGTIYGIITTADGQPAAYVTIALRGTQLAGFTGEDGRFALLNIPEGNYILDVSMVGLKSLAQPIQVKKDEVLSLNLKLAENEKQLSEVVVASGKSLNRRPVAIGKIAIDPMDLPQSVAVLNGSLIREQQASRLSDVLRNVNGVYLTTTRGNVQESFAARGYSFGNSNLFKNGIRVNSGVMPEVGSLERVEVLKGSAAILFGQVAAGGVVNMITKQPRFNSGGELSIRAGSYGLFKPSFDFYGPLSKTLAYRLNGSFETAGSFRDQVNSKRYYVNPSLLLKAGAKTEILLEGDYLYHEFTPDFGIGSLDNTKIPDVPRSRFMGTSWQYSKTRQATATATVKHQLSEVWKLSGSLGYQLYKRDYYSTERIQAAANGDWTRPLGRILTEENYWSGQINLNGRFKAAGMEHNLLIGVDADKYLTTAYGFSFPAVTGLPAGSYDKINILDPQKYVQRTDIPAATAIRRTEAPVIRFGGYVQDLVKITPKLNLMAGLRWSYVKTAAIDSLNLINGAATSGTAKTDKAFSPRFGLVYKPTQSSSIFASYANSFVVNTGVTVDGQPVDPSVIDQIELGVKNEFLNGLLSVNITGYRIINNNLAQTAPFKKDGSPNNDVNIKELTGQTTSDGVELDLAAHPFAGLDLIAGYSYNFIRYTKTAATQGSFKTGERLVNNPAHTANASISYTFQKNSLKGLRLGASMFYLGDRFGGWNNTVGQTQNYSRLIEVVGYATLDLSAGYTWQKWSLIAKVSNVTNTLNYSVHENYSINPIAPTQLAATLSYKF